MIYRIRMDGAADDPGQLASEFATMASHFGHLGFYEGIVGGALELPETVIESKYGEAAELRLPGGGYVEGGRHSFMYHGRHNAQFSPREAFDPALWMPQRQTEWRVEYVDEKGEVVPTPPDSAIVLARANRVPTDERASVTGTIDSLIEAMLSMPHVRDFQVSRDALSPGGYRATVEYTSNMASSIPGETLRDAVEAAYSDAYRTQPTVGGAQFTMTGAEGANLSTLAEPIRPAE